MISVILPMYNAEKTVSRALESVKGQLTDEEMEIIVIDDGCTDSSSQIVEDFMKNNPKVNIKLLHQKNKGVASARNAGIKASRGEFIALLDADDEWMPQKTSKQLDILKNLTLNIDFIACSGKGKKILWPYVVNPNGLAEITFKKLLLRNEILAPSVIFKRKVIENSGFFDDSLRHAEDQNYWYRVVQHNKMFILNEELIVAGGGKRTFGVSGLSANLKAMEKGFQKGLRDIKQLGYINFPQYVLYFLYFKLKYWLRLARNFYYGLQKNKNLQG